jgi:hypothetical protein
MQAMISKKLVLFSYLYFTIISNVYVNLNVDSIKSFFHYNLFAETFSVECFQVANAMEQEYRDGVVN